MISILNQEMVMLIDNHHHINNNSNNNSNKINLGKNLLMLNHHKQININQINNRQQQKQQQLLIVKHSHSHSHNLIALKGTVNLIVLQQGEHLPIPIAMLDLLGLAAVATLAVKLIRVKMVINIEQIVVL